MDRWAFHRNKNMGKSSYGKWPITEAQTSGGVIAKEDSEKRCPNVEKVSARGNSPFGAAVLFS
jgi:hypothetical protein